VTHTWRCRHALRGRRWHDRRAAGRSGSVTVVRRHTVEEEHVVSADVKRELLEVEANGDVVVRDDSTGRTP
jgi:hypothetical protein